MKTTEIVNNRMTANVGCERSSVDSRQQKAARLRRMIMSQINSLYGPEPRKAKRGLMFTLAQKARREIVNG